MGGKPGQRGVLARFSRTLDSREWRCGTVSVRRRKASLAAAEYEATGGPSLLGTRAMRARGDQGLNFTWCVIGCKVVCAGDAHSRHGTTT